MEKVFYVEFSNPVLRGDPNYRRARCVVCGVYQMYEFDEFLIHIYKCGCKVEEYV